MIRASFPFKFKTIMLFLLLPALSSCGGGGGGGSDEGVGFSTLPPVHVTGFARFFDANSSGILDKGDTVVVPFNTNVTVNSGITDSFLLPVKKNTFGTGSYVKEGPAPNEVTIVLGEYATLTIRRQFDPALLEKGSASGIGIHPDLMEDAIECTLDGSDAGASTPIDVIPAFSESGFSFGGSDTHDIAVKDLDGDGDLDVVTGDSGLANRIWLNDGTGRFTGTDQFLGSFDTRSVAVGDVNGDGFPDVVTGNISQPNTVWLNSDGVFTSNGQALGASATRSLLLGDLNGDGSPDLVEGNYDGPNYVWFNNGSGTFINSGQQLGLSRTLDLALGDMDNDGDLDFAAANDNGPVRIWLNDGEGLFFSTGQDLLNGSSESVALGDLDGDGDCDLAVLVRGEPDRVWRNHGDGLFADTEQELGASCERPPGASGGPDPASGFMEIFDYDSDGDLDLICGEEGHANHVWLNDGTGAFMDSGLFCGDFRTACCTMGDLDGDGDLDMITGNLNESNQIWINPVDLCWGRGLFFSGGQVFGTDRTFGAEVGDLDNDGDLDMVFANYCTGNIVWPNDGTGYFDFLGQIFGGNEASFSVGLGDLDQDGDLDLVIGNFGVTSAESNQVWLNNGRAHFTNSGQQLGNSWTTSIVLGDMDGDGDIDIVEGNAGGNQPNIIRLNDGTGDFSGGSITFGNQETVALAIGDLDRDGDLDIVEGNYLQKNKIWLNNGSGQLTNTSNFSGAYRTLSLALGDFDNDGELDIAEGIESAANRIFVNAGSGKFQDTNQQLGQGWVSYGLGVADVDGDGDVDLIVGNYGLGSSAHPNELWLNNGYGIFEKSDQDLDTSWTLAIAVGDLDSDGDPDFVAANDTWPDTTWFNE